LRVSGPPPVRQPLAIARGPTLSGSAIKGSRPVYSPERRAFHDTPVYDRYLLHPGDTFLGPAIVEERESTLVVGTKATVDVDDWLNLIVTLGRGALDDG
jgi:N-methylhydantoinase A/oxoprolinase/acetone carboxylase beta subunit